MTSATNLSSALVTRTLLVAGEAAASSNSSRTTLILGLLDAVTQPQASISTDLASNVLDVLVSLPGNLTSPQAAALSLLIETLSNRTREITPDMARELLSLASKAASALSPRRGECEHCPPAALFICMRGVLYLPAPA